MSPQQRRDEDAVRLLRHLFHKHYAVEQQIPQDKKGLVLPAHFLGWLHAKADSIDREAACSAAGVAVGVWEFVRAMLDSGAAPERLYQVWYSIALGDRPAPGHNLQRMTITALFHWEDGHVLPVQVTVDRAMMEGPGFNDGLVASLLARHVTAFANAVATDGLDGLHAKGQDYRGTTPEDPYELMMGLIVSSVPHLRPELRQPVTDWKLLAQGILRPVIPADVLAKFRRQQQPPAGPRGGFDG